MSSLTLQSHAPRLAWPAWREHGLALGVALALHAGVALVLLNLSHTAPLPAPVAKVLTTQLVSLPAPAVPAPPALAPPPAVVPPAPAPAPVVAAPKVAQAELALKRVEQARRDTAQQREQQQRREATLRQQQLARDEQQRQAHAQQQAQARQADAQRQAAAAAAAQAEAASRQYLPIAKQAPDYPQRALDRKLEGECTVAYRVNAQGRVEDPQVVGECHPLFVKPSLAAARSFRYQPRLVNGQAVAVANVKNIFTYRIQ